jgi:hypothetical protein
MSVQLKCRQNNIRVRTRMVFSFLFHHLTSPFRDVPRISANEYYMPLLPCCVRKSADGSGATSDVYTDGVLLLFFIFFHSPGGLAAICTEWPQMFNERTAVEVAASPTQTFTSFSFLERGIFTRGPFGFPECSFPHSWCVSWPKQWNRITVFLSPITSSTGPVLMAGSDVTARDWPLSIF